VTDYDPSRPLRPQLTDPLNEALSQPVASLSWRRRFVRWLAGWVGARLQLTGREATDGGYWGGVTFWDRLRAVAGRVKAAAATMFLRR
jgi:hypothetical protein